MFTAITQEESAVLSCADQELIYWRFSPDYAQAESNAHDFTAAA